MSKERFEYSVDEYDEYDWFIKDNTTNETYEYLGDITKLLNQQNQKITDLEAKLAESESEIEKLNACVDFYKSYYISFKEKVIDELEKVKEKINNCPITDYDTNKHFVKMYQSDAIRQLDNQINQLKEGEVV